VANIELAENDPLPHAKIEPAVGHPNHYGSAWRPITRKSASCVALQTGVGQACLRQAPVPRPEQTSSPVRLCTRKMGRQPLGQRRCWWIRWQWM